MMDVLGLGGEWEHVDTAFSAGDLSFRCLSNPCSCHWRITLLWDRAKHQKLLIVSDFDPTCHKFQSLISHSFWFGPMFGNTPLDTTDKLKPIFTSENLEFYKLNQHYIEETYWWSTLIDPSKVKFFLFKVDWFPQFPWGCCVTPVWWRLLQGKIQLILQFLQIGLIHKVFDTNILSERQVHQFQHLPSALSLMGLKGTVFELIIYVMYDKMYSALTSLDVLVLIVVLWLALATNQKCPQSTLI